MDPGRRRRPPPPTDRDHQVEPGRGSHLAPVRPFQHPADRSCPMRRALIATAAALLATGAVLSATTFRADAAAAAVRKDRAEGKGNRPALETRKKEHPRAAKQRHAQAEEGTWTATVDEDRPSRLQLN